MTGSSHKKFKVVTLGCRTNQYESAAYANQLKEMGYVEACDNEKADLCIVNTCTVTESADSSSRLEIRRLAKKISGEQNRRYRLFSRAPSRRDRPS